ncbi:MAG: XisI protein [Chitinophagales bacterium]
MEKITQYENTIIQLLEEYALLWNKNSNKNIETHVIADTKRKHYQLMQLGWDGYNYIHNCIFHFDIKDGKIWLQENRTDILIAQELVEKGIPKSDIVLGLQPPDARPLTEYGVA